MLCSFCQTISLIENDNFCMSWWKINFFLSEFFYLLSYDINTTFVWCIELLDCINGFITQKFSHNTQDTWSFSNTRRSWQDHMWDWTLRYTWLESGELIEVTINFVKSFGSVFLKPDFFHMAPNYKIYETKKIKLMLIIIMDRNKIIFQFY